MSSSEAKDDCPPPEAKQMRLATDEGPRAGESEPAVSQEAEAAQALWEMTNWRETKEPPPKGAEVKRGPSKESRLSAGKKGPNILRATQPLHTPERGDTGESLPHVPEGGAKGGKHPKLSKPNGGAVEDPVAQQKNGVPKASDKGDSEEDDDENSVLSPLSSDSEGGEADECCIVSVGTQPTSTDRSLKALEHIQEELQSVNERADRAFLQLKRRYGHLRKPHIQKRNAIIRTIPGFWVTAFLNHPQLSAMIDDRDEDTLSYMNNLQVDDFTHLKSSCKIKFHFNPNPYFKNALITKEFQYGSSGRLTSHSTPIRWWRGQNPSVYKGKSGSSAPSFFTWFSDHSFPAADRIAAIIKEDLWPNPLQYYLIGEGDSEDNAADDSDDDNLDDCVVIDDDDEEEGEEDDEDEENEVHEIPDNAEKQAEGTDEEDDEAEIVEEESVMEDIVESTTAEPGSGKVLLDVDDSEQSSEEDEDQELEEDEDG
uniref:Testis-specific Y-encoded-like protein 2 n=1 Tax=Leptobrachium leishanense TaxID=445787 RepID=A0A8C5MJX0_9ANUR